MVIRSGCIFYRPLSAGTNITFFCSKLLFCFMIKRFILRKILQGLFEFRICFTFCSYDAFWHPRVLLRFRFPFNYHQYEADKIHMDIKFNPTHEANGQINFLDLLLIRKPFKIEPDIFRKPTNTDTNINFFTNHSLEHKMTPYIYYITRIQSIPPTPERKQKEWTVIQYKPRTNNFLHTLFQKPHSQLQYRHNNYDRNNSTVTDIKTWTTFT